MAETETEHPEHSTENGHSCPHCAEISELKTAVADLAAGVQAAAEGQPAEAHEDAMAALANVFGDD